MQLLEPNRPEEVGRTANPKYCHYHMMVSHPLENCITLKEHIMQLIKDGTIILDLDDVVEIKSHFLLNKGIVSYLIWKFGG